MINVKNLDLLKQQKAEFAVKMREAVQNNDEEAFAEAFSDFANALQEAVIAEARGLVQATDTQILAGRGVRVLTSEEHTYYQKLIEAMRSDNPKQALSGFDAVLPETVINTVFDDITEEHPLLSEIRFDNAAALIKWLYSTMDGRFLAWWGPLCGEIKKQLAAQFNYLHLEQTKLSAFVPVCKAMLDLGPAWLDRYVRTILAEAIANGLEQGIISGRGLAEAAMDPDDRIYEPVGMDRNLEVFDNTTGYAPKVPIPVTQFTPAVYGDLASRLAVGPNGLNRTVTQLLMVVNPVDYFNKVMPATAFQRPDGSWVRDILPLPTKIVQSAYVEQGKAILGLAKRYIMAMGTGKGGRIEYSDEYRFLEDERTYLIKLYGTGRPMDNTSFLVLDIQNLVPAVPDVHVTNDPLSVAGDVAVTNDPLTVYPVYDARLASLKIGELPLSPAFNKSVMVYTAETSDATNKITAVAKDGEATIAIKVNDADHTNGTAATWDAGENTVEITVTSGTESETYTVTVTKS
jgi:hypothetical protein